MYAKLLQYKAALSKMSLAVRQLDCRLSSCEASLYLPDAEIKVGTGVDTS